MIFFPSDQNNWRLMFLLLKAHFSRLALLFFYCLPISPDVIKIPKYLFSCSYLFRQFIINFNTKCSCRTSKILLHIRILFFLFILILKSFLMILFISIVYRFFSFFVIVGMLYVNLSMSILTMFVYSNSAALFCFLYGTFLL